MHLFTFVEILSPRSASRQGAQIIVERSCIEFHYLSSDNSIHNYFEDIYRTAVLYCHKMNRFPRHFRKKKQMATSFFT